MVSTPENRALLKAFRRRVLEVIEADLARERAEAEQRRAEVLEPLVDVLREEQAQGRCGRAWLFGSFAWGRPGESSDVDLLVESCDEPDRLAATVWRAIDRPVHVIPKHGAPASLVERVLREGRLL